MEVVVIGGAGAAGTVIIKHLVKASEVSKVICADIAIERAKRLINKIRSNKLKIKKVNAADFTSVLNTLMSADLVINAARPEWNISIMDAAIETGTHYMDLAAEGLYKQLARDEEWKRANLSALISMGEAPGMSNIFAKYIADKLDTVDEIRIRDGSRVISEDIIFTFAPDIAIEELLYKSIVYENGKFKWVPSMTGEETYEFPKPVGPLKVYYANHEEVVTLPLFLGKKVKYVDFKVALSEEEKHLIKVLWKLGLTSREPIEVKGVKVAPMDVVLACIHPPAELEPNFEGHEMIVTDVKGEKDGKKVRYIMYSYMSHKEAYEKYGTHATAYMTGTPVAAAAIMLARGEIKRRGVFPAECLDADKFLKQAQKMGIKINEVVKTPEE